MPSVLNTENTQKISAQYTNKELLHQARICATATMDDKQQVSSTVPFITANMSSLICSIS